MRARVTKQDLARAIDNGTHRKRAALQRLAR
jgi:hypothetical protein